MEPCPTPNKRRYATAESAQAAAAYSAIGTELEPYFCVKGCRWWHLTTVRPLPHVDPAVVQELLDMDDASFLEVVSDDAKGHRNPAYSAALRDRALLGRWRRALGISIHDVDNQLQMHRESDEKDGEWRKRIVSYKTNLEGRRKECAALISEMPQHVRESIKSIRQDDEAALRGMAGDAAIQRLIDAHRSEFYEYVNEECKKISVEPPKAVRKFLHRRAFLAGESA